LIRRLRKRVRLNQAWSLSKILGTAKSMVRLEPTIIASFAIHPNIIDMILTPAEEEV